MAKTILVVGGAGYIGSHMLLDLTNAGYHCVILDDLSSGFRDAVLEGKLITGSLADKTLLHQIFRQFKIDAVLHFASHIQVEESVVEPAKYYNNNVANTLNLLETMLAFKVDKFIFSSTAAIFGQPQYTPIDEKHPKNPINPYGRSKWIVEQVLQDYSEAYGLRFVALRYFNAAGADPLGRLGERHEPETHLIPLILQTASKRRNAIVVYGNDYPTPDGTCIRDYIHVSDLCHAHTLALNYLFEGGGSQQLNLGNGQGFSVNEVIDTAKTVTRTNISVIYADRRHGDPAALVADASQAKAVLAWQPRYADLATIIEHAWRWEQQVVGR